VSRRRLLPRVGETWQTVPGRLVSIDDIGDQTLPHRARRITLRVGPAEGARYRVLLETFLKHYHLRGTTPRPYQPRKVRKLPRVLITAPAVGETWETALGVTCEIVDAGDQSIRRRDRKVTARMVSGGGGIPDGTVFRSGVAHFIRRWSRVAIRAVAA